MSPTHQDLSNDTTFSQIKSCVPVPLKGLNQKISGLRFLYQTVLLRHMTFFLCNMLWNTPWKSIFGGGIHIIENVPIILRCGIQIFFQS